jgi:site-specific DNA recombinase
MDGHVVRKINPAEAAVVRRISDMYADGSGYRHIAHTLNAQHVATPRAQRGNPSGWDMGTVKAVIERQLYRGIIEYKKTRKRDKFGRKKIAARPTSDLITVEAPHLRIVSEALAAAVDERRAGRRERYLRGQKGQLLGKPVLGKYLLSGLLVCRCGARFEAQKAHGNRKDVYICSAHRRKGAAVCDNRLALPIVDTEDRILRVIEGEVLQPSFIDTVLDSVFVPDSTDRPALESERGELERQLASLTEAVKLGGDIPTLVTALKTTNAQLASVRRRLEPQEQHDREQLRAALEQRSEEWKQILRVNPAQGR